MSGFEDPSLLDSIADMQYTPSGERKGGGVSLPESSGPVMPSVSLSEPPSEALSPKVSEGEYAGDSTVQGQGPPRKLVASALARRPAGKDARTVTVNVSPETHQALSMVRLFCRYSRDKRLSNGDVIREAVASYAKKLDRQFYEREIVPLLKSR